MQIYVQEWFPEAEPKVILLYIHGLGSHSSRLAHWAERFVNEQMAFIGYDQRGHGKTDGKRGQVKHIDLLANDLDQIIQEVKMKYEGVPVVPYAHSMGGAVLLQYLNHFPANVDGFIVSSPWIRLVKPPSGILLAIAAILKTLSPKTTLPNGLNPGDVIDDDEEVRKYIDDPLVQNKISVGLFYSLTTAMRQNLTEVASLKRPCLAMHGAGDPITDPAATEKCAKNIGDAVTLKIWDVSSHELHHDPARDKIFKYIVEWLEKTILLTKEKK